MGSSCAAEPASPPSSHEACSHFEWLSHLSDAACSRTLHARNTVCILFNQQGKSRERAIDKEVEKENRLSDTAEAESSQITADRGRRAHMCVCASVLGSSSVVDTVQEL